MSTTGYIAEVPGPAGTPALRFDYEPITEPESKAIREGWRSLDEATQVNEAVSFLMAHVSSCQALTNRPPRTDKDGNEIPQPPWEDVPVTEHNLRTALPKGHFAQMLWIVMGVRPSDPVPGEAAVSSVPSWMASKAAAPPIAPAEPEKPAAVDRPPADPATVDASTSTPQAAAGTSTPDQAAATSPTPEQTK